MKNFTFKMLLLVCILLIAGFANAQFKFTTNAVIGQTLSVDSVSGISTFIADFNTSKDSSYWSYTDETHTTFSITLAKCQTQRGLQVSVYDTDGTTKVINGDFECRDYGANRNPVRIASIASLTEILEKYEIKNAGTSDSLKNVTWKPSACLFDLDATGNNQAFGAHPGMYKIVEYGFQLNFSGTSVTDDDIQFDIDTYDAGNTGQPATYKLTVATGSATGIIGEVENFYVTGSGKKTVSVASAIGTTPSVFSNKKVYIFLKTLGTGTAMAKTSFDPTIVIDNLKVAYQSPSWISPAAGINANVTLDNSANPVTGPANQESLFGLSLKTSGRLGTLSIVNDRETESSKLFTFLATGAVKSKDAYGKYTVDVPYTFTAGSETVKEKIEIAAPADGNKVNDDLMLYVKATPTSTSTIFNKLELNCGVRIWFNLNIKGADLIDLSGIDDTNALIDTLPKVADGSIILLKPGLTYSTGLTNYSFDKSVEIRSADLVSLDLPIIDCAKNFVITDGSTIGSIVFKNVKLIGDYENNYVFNIDKGGTIGELRFESCKIRKLRGITRIKSGTGTLNKFSVVDCVVDSLKDYGVLAADVNTWVCNDILIQNSTISKAIMLFTSRNNSNTCLIENCTISEAPEKGKQMFRWRTVGQDNVTKGMIIRNTIWGHGWNTSGDYGDVLLDGFDGLSATSWTIENCYAVSNFGYAAGKDSIPGFPTTKYPKTAAELWVAPYSSDFNYLDGSFPGIGNAGDPRWIAPCLDTLYASVGTIEPAFSSGKLVYQLNLPASTSEVSFTAVAANGSITVENPSPVALSDGIYKDVEIVVSGPGGESQKTYTVSIHVASADEILFVSGSNTNILADALDQDKFTYALLKNSGYSVTFFYKYGITPSFNDFTSFDFSPYKAIVFSAAAPSAGTIEYATAKYPIPCVSMQKDGPKSDKWGWINKSTLYQELKITSFAEAERVDKLKMVVTNNEHYITSSFGKDEQLVWTSFTPDMTDFTKIVLPGYKMNDSISTAIPLTTYAGSGAGFYNSWAIPSGSKIGADYTPKRIVILGVSSDAMLHPTEKMDTLLRRSLEWVLGAGPGTSATEIEYTNDVLVYPNPATNFAKFRFTLTEPSEVSLSLVNMTGQVQEICTAARFYEGANEISVQTHNLKQGLYIYRLQVGSKLISGKLSIAK